MSIRFTLLLAITSLFSAGCCCLPNPACYSSCAPFAYCPAACVPMPFQPVPYAVQTPPMQYATMQQPAMIAEPQPVALTPSLSTIPRRQVLRDSVKLPRPPRPKWPITKQYSQSIQDLSLATATSSQAGSHRCECENCRQHRNSTGCKNCGQCRECESCNNGLSSVERSCAAPMSVFAERSCAAPTDMYAGEHFLNTSQSDCNCQNNQEVHYSDSSPTTSASNNAYVPPPAPVMAPPAENEPGLPEPNDTKDQAVDMTTRKRTTVPAPVPLPDVVPEPSSVREFKPIPKDDASPDKEPMPIIDLMSLQMPARSQVRTHANSDRTIKVETETITFKPTTVIRKRVQ